MKKFQKWIAFLAIAALAISMSACGSKAQGGYEGYKDAIDTSFSKGITTDLCAMGDDPATGVRSAGSPSEKEMADYIEKTMNDIGLENVTQETFPSDAWIYKGANLTFTDADGKEQKVTLGGYQTTLKAKDETLPLVYVGEGTAADYEGVNVKDKLVLIDINQDDEWWINYPAYQAKVKGAKAVIAMTIMSEKIPDRISSQDICGPADAPAFGISLNDSKAIQNAMKSSGKKEIEVVLNADSEVIKDSEAINVWGEIPGKSDETIIFVAHMDGYYHAFFDDLFGVGVILGMAKAFKDGGVKPEKTFRFIAHSAEEWGKSDSEADWAIGSYQELVTNHPDWAKEAFAVMNVDGAYMLEGTKSLDMSQPYEMEQFVDSAIESFGKSDVKLSKDAGIPSTWREDFFYNVMGIPTFAIESNKADDAYSPLYHSDKDTEEQGGFQEDTYKTLHEFLGHVTLELDNTPVKPFNFEAKFVALKESLKESPNVKGPEIDQALDEATTKAKELDEEIATINEAGELPMAEKNQDLYDLYLPMQTDLVKLTCWLEPQFAHEGLQGNIDNLNAAIKSLEEGDVETAVYENLSEIEFAYESTAFDKKTCGYFIDRMKPSLKDTWAEGRLAADICDTDGVIRSLMKKMDSGNKNFAPEIAQLKGLVKERQKALDKAVTGEIKGLQKATENMDKVLKKWKE